MAQLSLEILRRICEHLEREDLLKCQLTSKQWNDASVEALYSNIKINKYPKLRLYVRTLTDSPRLCTYLRKINIRGYFCFKQKNRLWDEFGLLNVLSKECPNLVSIQGRDMDHRFWNKISYLASQGKLSRLQYLPAASDIQLELYIYTALCFKNTLIGLNINDSGMKCGLDMVKLDAYPVLCNEINQFKNLQNLHICYMSNKKLCDFDTLIEDCQNLKKFEFYVFQKSDGKPIIETDVPMARPRPDITTFHCYWQTIMDYDSQLEYIMHKFPNLQYLKIEFKAQHIQKRKAAASRVLIEFFRYMLNIPKFQIELDLNLQDFIDIWIQFRKENLFNNELKIQYCPRRSNIWYRHDPPTAFINILGKELIVELPIEVEENEEPPHAQLLSGIGHKILSLDLTHWKFKSKLLSTNPLYDIESLERVFDFLRLCPLLQNLTFSGVFNVPNFEIDDFKHTELKSICVKGNGRNSLRAVEYLSNYLPHLQTIIVSFKTGCSTFYLIETPHYIYDVYVLRIPDISLNTLIWEHHYNRKKADFTTPFLFRFNVGNYERSYIFFEGRFIDTKCQKLAFEHTRVEINCKSLKEFIFNTSDPYYKAQLFF